MIGEDFSYYLEHVPGSFFLPARAIRRLEPFTRTITRCLTSMKRHAERGEILVSAALAF
ncbi:hypothetical protein PO124_04905 [Bacillus licheniformis]|nr:hypothetical protein [Bacillus licheniformis]